MAASLQLSDQVLSMIWLRATGCIEKKPPDHAPS